jgi:hypothetical protein
MITFKSGKLCHAYPSFGELVAEFKRLHGWDAGVPDGLLSPSADRQISTEFVDKSHSEQFRASHHNRATMRVESLRWHPAPLNPSDVNDRSN